MKLLVYGINYRPELTGIGKYSGEMVKWFVENGLDVRVITAPPYYPAWKVADNYSGWKYTKEKLPEVVFRCPLYVPNKPSTIKRLLHLSSFAFSSLFPLLMQTRWKPDYVICIVPTLFCVPGALLLRKLTRAKVIIHIQDFEVDAMLGLGMAKKGVFAKFAKKFEKWCLTSADKVSTISKTMLLNASGKGVPQKNLIFFPNWSELERFKNLKSDQSVMLKEEFGIAEDRKVILYSGNIGEKQGLEIVIAAAQKLAMKNYIFLFVGQGGGKENLEKMSLDLKLDNVIFKPLQPYDLLPALLNLADCHLVVQKKGAADAVLPSKLTNILAVGGNSVITAEDHTELGQLCKNNPGIAQCIEPESVDALISGIEQCLLMPRKNKIAIEYANASLDMNNVLSNFIVDIQN
ncbi:colanic acid biosynthesis glycosyl transferase WcaI [Klebsiella quasipneumoniae]|uniref:glycosyltransferase WbuB n=1 Tax=Klebsiella quasipneumoniae TaxID=1463165 RepID=UPI000871487E|nr:glycosyltransferase WbuB [Klebsiella quasipneumoniae]SCW73185.1 colanic acid biosynthesis glycosyl transferase WcaI [Klebsiella quasipneumoniae]SCX59035.1 colanic acid biosynthesis glycosyl transferase WcaI [Klebsiella quasipneumoniae]SCX64762.1 colanic acid biosynthesis glycosyl transferase WcaI [Klebsiella quasipneumoniae]SCY78519.1 colanic acid biosynthesis glycosyl transferase WcaI [Klebsiella quasipneumoniae]SCY93474.1 colanic acid biosynthesis glycosyl transferase WcaI [Klebsiella qua